MTHIHNAWTVPTRHYSAC